MSEVIKLYKNIGETPLECIQRFKLANPAYQDTKMTYLGRLDPMAEGLLLVLAGDTKDKDQYLSLDKTYEFEVLWGFATDTYDILGIITSETSSPDKIEKKLSAVLKKILNKRTQVYPAFSSKSFGKDFLKARESNIDMFELPERSIKIFSIDHIHTRYITGREMLSEIVSRVDKVTQDFRQEEVLALWKNALITRPNEFFLLSKFSADVSSGTYIRSLAVDMGKILGVSALAWSIKRTRVGEYKLDLV